MALTAAERQRRSREKRKIVSMGQGKGGVDRLSEMVMAKVKEGVASGLLEPTIKDGLAAERIIDTRAAKNDDRKAALAITLLLTGGSNRTAPPELLGDGMTVEGTAVEIE